MKMVIMSPRFLLQDKISPYVKGGQVCRGLGELLLGNGAEIFAVSL